MGFLNAAERAVPAGRVIKAIVDNDATYKHPNVRAWLTRQRIMHSEGPSSGPPPPPSSLHRACKTACSVRMSQSTTHHPPA
jgi:hypothetical protein